MLLFKSWNRNMKQKNLWLKLYAFGPKIIFNITDTPHCNKTYFTCGNESLQCIPLLWVCDKDPECSNGNDESEHLCQNVGACGGHLTAPNGLIYSPSYPENYPINADCIYTISQPAGTVILLKFLSMDIEDVSTCDWDYLEIRDGPLVDSPLLDKLCGNEIPAPIQSSQNQLWMK